MTDDQILDCFIPSFKLKYEESENIQTDCVNTVVFNLHQIRKMNFFFEGGGHPPYEYAQLALSHLVSEILKKF